MLLHFNFIDAFCTSLNVLVPLKPFSQKSSWAYCSPVYHHNNFVIAPVQNGKAAIHFAAQGGHLSAVEVLTGAFADINLRDKVVHMCAISLPNNVPPTSWPYVYFLVSSALQLIMPHITLSFVLIVARKFAAIPCKVYMPMLKGMDLSFLDLEKFMNSYLSNIFRNPPTGLLKA